MTQKRCISQKWLIAIYAKVVSFMVKRSRAERAASAGGRVAGRSVGTGIGSALSSPFGLGVLGVGALLGGLIIFRKQIANFFNNLPGQIAGGLGDINIQLPSIEFPDITFPDITFPDFKFPDITFPDFFGGGDDSSSIAGQTVPSEPGGAPVTIPADTVVNPDGTVSSSTPPTIDLGVSPGQLDPLGEISFNQLKSGVFDTLTNLGLTPSEAFGALKNIDFDMGAGFGALDDLLQSFNAGAPGLISESGTLDPLLPPDTSLFGFDDTVLNLIGTDQEFTGGGQGFMGGAINPTPITTLSQVIALFPGITASQAANFLSEFSGILPEAALLQGFDLPSLSTAPGDPPQIFNQTSIPGLTGTPEEIFKFLFPNL